MTQYRSFFHFSLLFIAIAICYSNTLHQEFHFDDIPNITQEINIRITSLKWSELKKSFYTSYEKEGIGDLSRPVSRLTFALNYLYSKYDTTSYHVVNIAIHVIAAYLLYQLFQIILKIYNSAPPSSSLLGNLSQKQIADIALLGALLWALHPIQTNAVTYIVQRMASLAGMFYFGAFLLYLKSRLAPKKSKQQIIYFLAAASCWVLGILSKENAVLLPVSIFIFELCFFPNDTKKLPKFLGLFFILLLTATATHFIFATEPFDFFAKNYAVRPFTLTERLLTEPRILLTYLSLLLLPINTHLSLERGLEISRSLVSPPSTSIAIFVVLLLIVGPFLLRKRFALLSFTLLFFFTNHLVESTVIPLELYFEHRNYIPSAFIFLLIAVLISYMVNTFHYENKIVYHFILFFFTCYLVCTGISTWLRNDIWRDEMSLHTDSTSKTELTIRPYVSVAAEHMRNGDYETSQEFFKKAEKIYNTFPEEQLINQVGLLYYNAGILHLRQQHVEKAKRLLYKSLEYTPKNTDAYANIGYLCFLDKDLRCAETAFKTALEITPKPFFYISLGHISFEKEELELAIDYLQNGLLLGEKSNLIRYNLIACNLKQNRINEAKKYFYQLYPSDNDMIYHLYGALLEKGMKKRKHIEKLVHIIITKSPGLQEWFDGIENQKHVLVISPDITPIKKEIAQVYISHLRKQKKKLSDIVSLLQD